MRLHEVLAAVEGLDKRFVHYLEAQGYIRPRRLPKARIARRDYRPEDLRRIRAIWRYYRRGFSLQRAAALALAGEAAQARAYLLCAVPAHAVARAVALAQEMAHVLEAAPVYAESGNLLICLEAPEEGDPYLVLDRLLRAGLVAGLPHVWRARWAVATAPAEGGSAGMLAWVLLKVPAKHIDALVQHLATLPGVTEAAAVYGETDIIARLEVPDQQALDELVMHSIQDLPAVESTRTFIAVSGMHWRREAPTGGAAAQQAAGPAGVASGSAPLTTSLQGGRR